MLEKLIEICKDRKLEIAINFRTEMIFVVAGYEEWRCHLNKPEIIIKKIEEWFFIK